MKYCKYILLWVFFALSFSSPAQQPNTLSVPVMLIQECTEDEDNCIQCAINYNQKYRQEQLQNLLAYAIYVKMEGCAARLIALGIDPNYLPDNNQFSTPLNIAARFNAQKTTILLVSAGATPNKPDCFGTLPVIEAIKSGHCAILPLLFARGGTLNPVVQSEWGKLSALTIAIVINKFDCIKELVQLGADINRLITGEREDMNGLTPLMISMTGQSIELAKRLVNELGASVEARNHNGDTVLMMMVKMRLTKAVEVLVEELDADILATDFDQQNSIQIARNRDSCELAQYLEETWVNRSSVLSFFVFVGQMYDAPWEEKVTYTVSTLALALIPMTLILGCCRKCCKC